MAEPAPGDPEPAESAALVRLLGARSGQPVTRIETHAAFIFLTGDRAWKAKRPVRLAYLDFSSPARRRAALEAELRLNRRTAPDLYLGVHAVVRGADGALALDGTGAPVEWLLEMRRFPDGALLDEQVARGTLDPAILLRLADRLVAFHAEAAICPDPQGAARLRKVIDGNAASFAAAPLLDPATVADLLERQRAALEEHAGLLDQRARAGRVRHCHGDLHLANIALVGGEAVPFDCLEFDAELATIDVLYDLAFLLMDLCRRDGCGEAARLLDRYLDRSPQDHAGVVLMPLLLSVRAAIRAHVAAARADRDPGAAQEARACLAFARRALASDPPMLALRPRGGVSG